MTEAEKVLEGLEEYSSNMPASQVWKRIDAAIAMIQALVEARDNANSEVFAQMARAKAADTTIAERDAEIERLKAENEGLINAYDSIANELASLCNP